MSGHGSTGGLLTASTQMTKWNDYQILLLLVWLRSKKIWARERRTIVNEEDAFGGRGRDVLG